MIETVYSDTTCTTVLTANTYPTGCQPVSSTDPEYAISKYYEVTCDITGTWAFEGDYRYAVSQ